MPTGKNGPKKGKVGPEALVILPGFGTKNPITIAQSIWRDLAHIK